MYLNLKNTYQAVMVASYKQMNFKDQPSHFIILIKVKNLNVYNMI